MQQHSKHLVYLKPHILCESNIPHFDIWKQQKFPKCDLFTIKVTDFSKSDHKNTKMKIFYHCTSAPNLCILRLLLFTFHRCGSNQGKLWFRESWNREPLHALSVCICLWDSGDRDYTKPWHCQKEIFVLQPHFPMFLQRKVPAAIWKYEIVKHQRTNLTWCTRGTEVIQRLEGALTQTWDLPLQALNII